MSQNARQQRTKILRKRGGRIARRLSRRHWEEQPEPIMTGSNIHYEMAERSQGMGYGGIGAIHKLVKQLGLDKEIDQDLKFRPPDMVSLRR